MAKLTLAPMDVVLSADGRTLQVVRARKIKRPEIPPGTITPTFMIEPGHPWTTFVTRAHRERHVIDFANAPTFDSFEDLAMRAPNAFSASATTGPLYARVRAHGAVSMAHIDRTLAALPEESELIVGVEWGHGE
jgi:hypothetical protein